MFDENVRLKTEVVVLKQTIDALCRRVFGKSSGQLDASQPELFDPPKKRRPPIPRTKDSNLHRIAPTGT